MPIGTRGATCCSRPTTPWRRRPCSSRRFRSGAGRCASSSCRSSSASRRRARGRSSSARCATSCRSSPSPSASARCWAGRRPGSTPFSCMAIRGSPDSRRRSRCCPSSGRRCITRDSCSAPGERLAIGEGGERKEVVVSAGGGAVGIEHLALALAAQPKSRFGHLTWRVLAGPNIPDEGMQRLLRAAGPMAVVERARVDFPALLRQAFVSVSQGGYNTVMDVVVSGARPVVVPFTGNGETEQRARGVRLERVRSRRRGRRPDEHARRARRRGGCRGHPRPLGTLDLRQRRRGAGARPSCPSSSRRVPRANARRRA